MSPAAEAIVDEICRRELRQPLAMCRMVSVDPAEALSALQDFLRELGASEAPARFMNEEDEQIAVVAVKNMCETGTMTAMRLLVPDARDMVRALIRTSCRTFEIMAETQMPFGKAPEGLRGRGLALALLARETVDSSGVLELLSQAKRPKH